MLGGPYELSYPESISVTPLLSKQLAQEVILIIINPSQLSALFREFWKELYMTRCMIA